MEVLRHAPQYLRQLGRFVELFELARNAPFLEAQRDKVPEQPDLPLATIRAALEAAADRDDAPHMAEFCVRYARLFALIQRQSPLDALRAGNMERAIRLLDLADPEQRMLWHLVLVWEMSETGKKEQAQMLLTRLRPEELPRLTCWTLGSCAAEVLAGLTAAGLEGLAVLTERLLGSDEARRALCMGLAARKLFKAAFASVYAIEQEWQQAYALEAVACGQAQEGQFDDALATTQAITEAYHRAGVYAAIARILARAGQFQMALATAEKARDREEVLQEIAVALAEAGQFPTALATTLSIDIPYRRVEALTSIARAQGKAGQVAAAKETIVIASTAARPIYAHETRTRALGQVALAQASAGELEAARATIAHASRVCSYAKSPRTRAEALAALAETLANLGEVQTSRERFAEALAVLQSPDSAEGRGFALRGIARKQAEVGFLTEALETARSIEDSQSAAWTFWDVARAQARAGEAEAANATLVLGVGIARTIENVPCQGMALAALTEVYVELRRFDAAAVAALAIPSPFDAVKALRKIVWAQERVGDRAGARTTFARVIRPPQLRPLSRSLVRTLTVIAQAQAEAGSSEAARATFSLALDVILADNDSDARASALSTLAVEQADVHEFAGAVNTARLLGSSRVCADVLTTVARQQFREGEEASAQDTLALAFEVADRLGDLMDRSRALSEIAQVYASLGQSEESQRVFARSVELALAFESANLRIIRLKDIIAAQTNARLLDAALITASTLQEHLVLEDAVPKEGLFAFADAHLYALALADIAGAQASEGNHEAACATLAAALEAAQAATESLQWAETLARLVSIQLRVNRIAEALQTTESIRGLWPYVEAMTQTARAQASVGESASARETLKQVVRVANDRDEPEVQSSVLIAAARTLADVGHMHAAHATLAQAGLVARTIDVPKERTACLLDVAQALAAVGEALLAHQTLIDALSAIREIDYHGDRWMQLNSLVKALPTMAHLVQVDTLFVAARDVARSLEDDVGYALSCIAKAQVQAGFPEDALRTADGIWEDRSQYLMEIASCLAEHGHRQHFKRLLVPCAVTLDRAIQLCGLIVMLYPEHVTTVAGVVVPEWRGDGD